MPFAEPLVSAAAQTPEPEKKLESKFSKLELMHMADSAADYYGIPQDMMRAQIGQESGWNVHAAGTSGEIGLSQFMPATAKSYFPADADLSGGPDDIRRDPRQSIDAQARYMLDLYKQSKGSWEGALMGYNTGRTFPTPKGREYVSAVAGMSKKERALIEEWTSGAAVKRQAATMQPDEALEKLKQTDVLAGPVASFRPLQPVEPVPDEYKYHLLKQGIPAVEAGAEEPPWFNPPMLLANILSGGITAGPKAAAKMTPGMLLGSVAGSAVQDLAEIATPKWGWVAGLATDMATGMATHRAVEKWSTRLATSRGLKGKQAEELARKLLIEVESDNFQAAVRSLQEQKALPAPGRVGGQVLGPETAEGVPGFIATDPSASVRRPRPPAAWETGEYPEVWFTERGKAVMSPETFQGRADAAQGFTMRPGEPTGNLPAVQASAEMPAVAPAAPAAPAPNAPLVAVAPSVGADLGGTPPPGKPYLTASFDDPKTKLRYEWHNMPDPEYGESGRRVIQEIYRGDQVVNRGSIVSGPQERVDQFLNSDPSGRFQAAQKFQPSQKPGGKGILGNEAGTWYPFGQAPDELPPPAQLAKNLVNLTEQGLRPEQALSQMAKQYGRKPQEIVDLLRKSNTPSVVAAAPEVQPGETGPIVKQRVDEGVTMPPVYAAEARQIKELIDQAGSPSDPMASWAGRLGRKWTTETAARTMMNRMPPYIQEWYRNIREAGANAGRAYKHSFTPELEAVQKSLPPGASKRIGAYMASQDPTGAATVEQMGVKVPELTPAEMQGVQWFQRTWEDFYTKLNEARVAAGKAPFDKVDNYYTFMRKFNVWQELGFNPVWADVNDLERAAMPYIHPRTTPFRFAKKREGGFDPINLDAFAVMRIYARNAFDHIHLSPLIGKYREHLGNLSLDGGKTTFSIRDNAPHYNAFLTDWLDNVGGKMNVEFSPGTDRALIALSRNNSFATLAGNIASAAVQPSALVMTKVEIGTKYLKQGIADNLSPQKRAWADKVFDALVTREYDASIKDAMASVSTRVKGRPGEVIEAGKKAQKAVGYAGMRPLEVLDYEAARITALGSYRQATESLGLTGKEALNYANDMVVKTQGSAARWDVSPFQRHALGRVLGPFQTFVINQWGWLTKDVLGLGRQEITSKEAFKKVVNLIATATAYNIVSEDLLGIRTPFPRPIKAALQAQQEGKGPLSTAWEVTKEAAQLYPVVGGSLRYGSTPLGATIQLGESLAKGGTPSLPLGEIGMRAAGVPLTVQASKLLKAREGTMTTKEALLGRTTQPQQRKNPWGGWSD